VDVETHITITIAAQRGVTGMQANADPQVHARWLRRLRQPALCPDSRSDRGHC
jgi:hypothetical protein